MYFILKSNLGRRILLLVGISLVLMTVALVISGWLAVQQSTERISYERQALAQATGQHLDYILRQNLERLDSIRFSPGFDIEDSDPEPERQALHSVFLASIFDGGVFITDNKGVVLRVEPLRQYFIGTNVSSYPTVAQCLESKKPIVSSVYVLEPSGKPLLLIVVPLRNIQGLMVGVVCGQIDPTGRALREFTLPIKLGATSYIDVIDGNGAILASSDPNRLFKQLGTLAFGAEVREMARLDTAPWYVSVSQSAKEALAPVRTMQQRFIVFGIAALVIALLFSWGMARSLVRPIEQLKSAAQEISQGDLSHSIPQLGTDEIAELGRSFDTMRLNLKKSLEEIQQWNRELEAKVEERTKQLKKSYQEIEEKEATRRELLRKILTVQEDERKRIARELHDETTQSLVGLVMRLEAATAEANKTNINIKSMLADIKSLAVRTLDNVHKLIFDLRPLVLDDLGLLSALRWYVETRLGGANIKAHIELPAEERKLPPQVEIGLFRVVQEAITNIVRHAEAHNVVLSVEFKDSAITIEIEDDGKGFNVDAVSPTPEKVQGLGLLGMKERVTLLGGSLHIESQPGGGTDLTIEVPLDR